jgi:hypothetical protein
MEVVHPYVMAPLPPSYVAQQKAQMDTVTFIIPSGSYLRGNGIVWDNPGRVYKG